MSRAEQAQLTREAILDAAEECFAAFGFRATTIRKVAQTAELNKGLIHHYFGSKDSLYQAVVRRAVADYEVTQAAQWDRDPEDTGLFTAGLTTMFDWLRHNRLSVRFLMWERLEGRLAKPEESDALREKVRQQILRAQSAGVLRPELHIDVVLVMIDTMLVGFWERAEQTRPLEGLAELYIDQGLQVLFRGILTERALEEIERRNGRADPE
ncbi:MAG: TetR/AcrR family transcriptional regulator [Myxococcota bacterium]